MKGWLAEKMVLLVIWVMHLERKMRNFEGIAYPRQGFKLLLLRLLYRRSQVSHLSWIFMYIFHFSCFVYG